MELKQTKQKIFLEQDTVPSIRISDPVREVVSPSFSVEIDFNDPQDVGSDIISEQFAQEPFTNSVEQLIPVQVQSEPEDQVFNFPSEPSMDIFTIPNIPKPQKSPPPIPPPALVTPTFKFPTRIPAEPSVPSPVQQSSPTVQTSVPSLLPPPSRPDTVLPQAVPAVPGRPVLGDDTVQIVPTVQPVQFDTVQSIPTVKSSFIPMPVPAVPMLSN